ncbi:MAG: alpha-L-fucosidase [bacterium]|nr:alpha-L-fucosidase [bacterium]
MALAAAPSDPQNAGAFKNAAGRDEWFMDLALGMFIHWGVDSQLGSVISHSLAGASDDYIHRFYTELPKTFEPRRFDPKDWARLARVAGIKYVMFTAKHHSGFCMWDTASTPFNVMNTPHNQDIVRQVADAFRAEGLAVGMYFSPEDAWVLNQQGRDIARKRDYAYPKNNPELREHNRKQLGELFSNYGPIDLAFLDSFDNDQAVEDIWAVDPNVCITRGVMATPEQSTPDGPMPGPWEACYTMGNQWQFKPTNEEYKSGGQLINMLIEMRAKGGNFLLNVGPTPDGEIPFEQERRIRELALWLFVNQEAVYETRPWHVVREGDIWFTKGKDSDTLYAILTNQQGWRRGARRDFTIRSAQATADTTVEVLGHAGRLVEYDPSADATPRFTQEEYALRVSVVRAHRLYNDSKWPNPVVVKLTNVKPREL